MFEGVCSSSREHLESAKLKSLNGKTRAIGVAFSDSK